MTATVKVITKPPRTLADQAYVPAIAQGLRLTMGRFFKNTFSAREDGEIVTLMYPEETEAYPERFRGIHRLTQRADGSPRCVACLCCSDGLPRAVHPHRGRRVRRGRPAARLRALPRHVRHRRAALHLLRLLRGGVPV
jgi:hypothetical protein